MHKQVFCVHAGVHAGGVSAGVQVWSVQSIPPQKKIHTHTHKLSCFPFAPYLCPV